MAKWLDKYEQGGLVLKKKTKDNYGTKPNVNDAKVSAGPNFVGEGYTAYNWKSPAWGGQFEMGGSLPGSVGFMYARTQNPAPANGKYTKKTLASAQKGIVMPEAELTPDISKSKSKLSTAVKSGTQDSTATNLETDSFGQAYSKARKQGKTKFSYQGKDYSTKYKGTPEEQLKQTGITDAQLHDRNIIQEQLAKNLMPVSYDKLNAIGSLFTKNEERKELEKLAKTNKGSLWGVWTPEDAKRRLDAFNLYSGLPQKYNTFSVSKNKPSVSKDKDAVYYSITNDKLRKYLDERIVTYDLNAQKDIAPQFREFDNSIQYIPGTKNKIILDDDSGVMGHFTATLGKDEKGYYVSYYDKWDVAPKDFGKPLEIYDKIYLKDLKTDYKPKLQNGGEMEYYQNGLDFKPKSISKKGKKIIKDDRGQWAHPGEITEIASNDITMQGVDYPVLGISDTGDTQMMYPDQDYKFDGKKVTEYPVAQDGDWLKKYAMQPRIQESTRNKQFEESVKNTIDQYRRAIDPENQPHISKWTPKPGEIKRLEEQDRQRREENSGFLNRLAANPHVAKLQNNVLIPMFDLYTVGEGAVAAKAIAKPALKQAGKYLTEKTALKNAYKLNPKAFKPTEGMMYRGLGKEGMEDAFESGVFRAKQDVKPIMHGPFDFSKQFNKAYFSPQFDVADRYGKGYIAEVPRAASDWGKRYVKKEWSQIAQKDIPITEGKILQKDWWKGYKEVPRNKMSAPEITRGPVNWWESPTFKKNNPNYDPTKPPLNPFPKYTAENVPEELKPYLTWDTEIDWGKWNPEIPKNEKLMQEYINIENTAKNEGTWMKNYDGTPFAGTPEQFVQSRSENFKKAFPKGADVVYRGDRSHYEAIRGKGEELYGKPIFTTPDKELAELYAYKEPVTSPYYNPNIETVEQKLQRMYGPDMTVEKFRNEYPEIAGRILDTNDGGLYELAIPKTTNELTFDANKNLFHYLSNPEVYDKLIKEGIVPHKRPEPGIFDTDNIAKLVEKTGLDRATIKNVNDGKISDVLIHNQRPGNYAKSLRGNSGMFDMNNPNIYKTLIPAVGTAGLVGASQKKHGGWLNKYK